MEYTPHNNKLYVYPYNYMVLSTTNGVQKELRFELFEVILAISCFSVALTTLRKL